MKFVYDDGGRAAAGYSGEARDCVTCAIAIATGKAYQEVYDDLNRLVSTDGRRQRRGRRSSARTGVPKPISRRYLASLEWKWVPTMKIGSGCTVHLRTEELPPGRLVVAVSRHFVAVIDGVVHDTHDCTRNGSRCVYGYFVAGRP